MKPLDLERLQPEQVRLLNTLFRYNSGVAFLMAGREFLFHFAPALSSFRSALRLDLELADIGAAGLELDSSAPLTALASFLDLTDVVALPGPVLSAAVEAFCEDVFNALALAGVDGQVNGVHFGKGKPLPECSCLFFTLQERDKGLLTHGRLWLPWKAVERAARAMEALPLASPRDVRAVPLPLVLEVGWMRLPLELFRDLETGDVLLPDVLVDVWAVEAGEQVRGAVRLGERLRLAVLFSNASITIERQLREDMDDLWNEEPNEYEEDVEEQRQQAGKEAVAPPGQVEVSLVFEAGRMALTVDELASIQPGQVLELSAPLDRGVVLRANGTCIGRGSLVDVGGQLGVQVLELGDE